MTCLICPNGCGLMVREKEGVYLVGGNRCPRGVLFAERESEKEGIRWIFQSEVPFLRYPLEEIAPLLEFWGLVPDRLNEDRFIQGSPERSLYRTLVECGGERLILEQIEPDRADRHEMISRRLDRLSLAGLPVTPFRRGREGRAVLREGGRAWQLTPFVEGAPLNRRDYWRDEWRGRALGEFLCALYGEETPDRQEEPFDLVGFINALVEKIALRHGELLSSLVPVLHRLEETLFPRYGEIPPVLGHGDPHPLNIIWGRDRILSVIDWEFCGAKPVLYDAALIMGCVGSETPEAFDGPFNRAFYGEMKKTIPGPWLGLLPDFILAQRFAWLNEWLRHGDGAMVGQEIRYMNMLL